MWLNADSYWLAALLADGRRRFVRYENGVFSTDVWEFIRVSDGERVVFQVFI